MTESITNNLPFQSDLRFLESWKKITKFRRQVISENRINELSRSIVLAEDFDFIEYKNYVERSFKERLQLSNKFLLICLFLYIISGVFCFLFQTLLPALTLIASLFFFKRKILTLNIFNKLNLRLFEQELIVPEFQKSRSKINQIKSSSDQRIRELKSKLAEKEKYNHKFLHLFKKNEKQVSQIAKTLSLVNNSIDIKENDFQEAEKVLQRSTKTELSIEQIRSILTIKDRIILLNLFNFIDDIYDSSGSYHKTAEIISIILGCKQKSAFNIVRNIFVNEETKSKNEKEIHSLIKKLTPHIY